MPHNKGKLRQTQENRTAGKQSRQRFPKTVASLLFKTNWISLTYMTIKRKKNVRATLQDI